ncbi:MAG TPA: phosphatase domain-containing protein [Geminicoccaceae bacterium]
MSKDWKSPLIRAGHRIESRWDRLRRRVKTRLGWLDPVTILPFRGHGDRTRVWLKGRVLEAGGLEQPGREDHLWTTLRHMYHRFESDEVPGARVRATFDGRAVDVVSDEEGYIEVAFDGLDGPAPAPESRWREVRLELQEPLRAGQGPTVVRGQVLIPPPRARFGVISDVDDTILKTGATSLFSNLRTTLLNTAEARLPFMGVAAFYRALEHGTGRGAGAGEGNPIFYVSSSPWNLYDILERFKLLNGIPLGPLFLRDLGWEPDRLIKGTHAQHKIGTIERLLAFYPGLSFVLIGDSGQHDAMIYKEIVHRHPGRIAAVYIRDVTGGAHDGEIRALFEEVQGERTEVVISPDLLAAAKHAAAQGLVEAEAVAAVRAEIEADRRAGA